MVTRDKLEMKLLLKSVMWSSFRGYATTVTGFTAMEQAPYSNDTEVVLMRNMEHFTLFLLLMEFPVRDIFAAYLTFWHSTMNNYLTDTSNLPHFFF
jgi:hypothetical protein